MKQPEFISVEFGSLRPWGKNPREASKKDAEILAKNLKEKGVFRNFVCWQEKSDLKAETYTVGGGNLRYKAMKEILKIRDSAKVMISLNFPENEKEKIELSLLDNMPSGSYVEQALAELIYPYREEINLKDFRIPLTPGTDLDKFLEGFGPGEVPEIEELTRSDRHAVAVVCTDDDDLLDMRELLGVDGKENEITSTEMREILKRGK